MLHEEDLTALLLSYIPLSVVEGGEFKSIKGIHVRFEH